MSPFVGSFVHSLVHSCVCLFACCFLCLCLCSQCFALGCFLFCACLCVELPSSPMWVPAWAHPTCFCEPFRRFFRKVVFSKHPLCLTSDQSFSTEFPWKEGLAPLLLSPPRRTLRGWSSKNQPFCSSHFELPHSFRQREDYHQRLQRAAAH